MEKFPPAACTKFSSSHRQASTTPLFDVVFPNISTWKLFKTSPLDSNLGYHTYIRVYTHICTHRFVQLYHVYPGTSTGEVRQLWLFCHADYCNFVNF
jgi:hypothetical protein